MRRFSAACLLALILIPAAACRRRHISSDADGSTVPAGTREYSLRGTVVATDESGGTVTLNHQAIPGFMPAMTMPYHLVQPDVISELHPGDQITARVLVQQPAVGPQQIRLDQIDVIGQANVNHVPAIQYHVPAAGDVVPDFAMLDQSGHTIHLAQFRGKVVLLTFIYTRCPLPDFCVRMSNNFKTVDDILAKDPAVYERTHLLSISFDPEYDTPSVLRSYGGAHTGYFTREKFTHWSFAAPSRADLLRLEQYFDVGVSGSDPSTLTHSLSTVLIGADGRILAWYPSNSWDPAQVAAAMSEAVQTSRAR